MALNQHRFIVVPVPLEIGLDVKPDTRIKYIIAAILLPPWSYLIAD